MEQQSLYNSTSFSNHGLVNVNILSTLLRPTAQKKKKKKDSIQKKKRKATSSLQGNSWDQDGEYM